MKLDMNYSAYQKRDDWRLRRFQSNMPSTEVLILFVGTIHKNKETFIRVRYSVLICCLELTVVFLLLIFEHSIEKSVYSQCENTRTKLCQLLGVFRYC